jgi:RimJ/RimL family protein N-acetyltransferase
VRVLLATERLRLRRFTGDDLDALCALNSDPAVLRYLTGGVPIPRAVVEREVLPKILGYYERYDSYGWFAAQAKATGEFLGWFEFRPGDEPVPGEVGLSYVRTFHLTWDDPIPGTEHGEVEYALSAP